MGFVDREERRNEATTNVRIVAQNSGGPLNAQSDLRKTKMLADASNSACGTCSTRLKILLNLL